MAKLYFTYSAMNAGKSALLLQSAHNYSERGMSVMLWTSSHHAPDPKATEGRIVSRIGLSSPARVFRPGLDLFAAIEAAHQKQALAAVFFDEAQFLTEPQVWALARAADDLDVPVLTYGLRTDFTGALFEGAAALLAIADGLREARTICWCGAKATMNLRRDAAGRAVTGGERVGVAKEIYTPLCRKHFREALDSAEDADTLKLGA